jgi:hypothetical protein
LWLIFLQGNEVYFDVKKVNADALSFSLQNIQKGEPTASQECGSDLPFIHKFPIIIRAFSGRGTLCGRIEPLRQAVGNTGVKNQARRPVSGFYPPRPAKKIFYTTLCADFLPVIFPLTSTTFP